VRNNPGPGGPNWGTVTAEDDPPSPSRCYGGSTGRIFFSIAVQKAARNEHQGRCRLVQIVRPSRSVNEDSFHSLRVLSATAWMRKPVDRGSVQPNGAMFHSSTDWRAIWTFCAKSTSFLVTGKKTQWSEFLVQLRFWGFLFGALV